MAKYDYKDAQEQETPNQDMLCATILLASLIKAGATKSAAPREAAMLLIELKKAYAQAVAEHKV
jgi:hypothetical protein